MSFSLPNSSPGVVWDAIWGAASQVRRVEGGLPFFLFALPVFSAALLRHLPLFSLFFSLLFALLWAFRLHPCHLVVGSFSTYTFHPPLPLLCSSSLFSPLAATHQDPPLLAMSSKPRRSGDDDRITTSSPTLTDTASATGARSKGKAAISIASGSTGRSGSSSSSSKRMATTRGRSSEIPDDAGVCCSGGGGGVKGGKDDDDQVDASAAAGGSLWRGKENVAPEGERPAGGLVATRLTTTGRSPGEMSDEAGATEDADMTDVDEVDERASIAPGPSSSSSPSARFTTTTTTSSSSAARRPTAPTLRRSMTVPVPSSASSSSASGGDASSFGDTFAHPGGGGDGGASGGASGKRRRARPSLGLGIGSAPALQSSSSSSSLEPAAPANDASEESSKRRRLRGGSERALGRSLSYNDASQQQQQTPPPPLSASLVRTPTSASSTTSRRSSSRRPSVGSSSATAGSASSAASGARRLSRATRQASVSSTISVRSEHTPAPSSASSSRSSWSLAPETPQDEKDAGEAAMDVDRPTPSTPPQEIRAFDDLTITPKSKQRARPALDRTPTRGLGSGRRGASDSGPAGNGPPSTPDLSDAGAEGPVHGPASSSPLEFAVITPEPSPQHASTVKQSTARELDGYRALKQILRCASAAGGGSAMAALMASAQDAEAEGEDVVVGREAERAVLSRYLSSSPNAGSPTTSLYVSGPPGTGKTAVVSASIAALPATCRISFVNCMSLASSADVWSRVGADWGFPASAVEHCTGLDTSGSTTYVLVLDEVDCLLSSGQILHALLCLPAAAAPATVKVIAISNSLDLTARASIAALLGGTDAQPENLTFAAYGSKDMVQIVRSRVRQAAGLLHQQASGAKLSPVDFDDKAIELVARKVEATNGDLRACLAVAHGAVEVAEEEWRKKVEKMGNGSSTGVPPIKVSLPHVLKAVAAHNKLKASSAYGSGGASSASSSGSSAVDNKVRSLNLQVRIILLSLLVARRSGTGAAVTAEALYPTYVRLLGQASSPFVPAAQADYLDLVMQAEVVGLISVEAPNRKGPKRAARTTADRPLELLVREQDLLAALGVGKVLANTSPAIAIESEIRTIWGKEEHRWKLAEARKARAEGRVES